MMQLEIRELTPDQWPALEDLFDTTGPVGRCWCMYWRVGAAYRRREPGENRQDLHDVVFDGPPPGILAFDGDLAVGWCQLTPRRTLSALDEDRRFPRVDDSCVASISCLYVRTGYRRQGVTAALVEAAVDHARRRGWEVVEAYPLDAEHSTSATHTGYATTFERAGFVTVARPTPSRPIMRLDLAGP